MSRIVSQNKIDEIREATDVVEFVSGYVTLKKSGQNYFGLCPFHTEKTPSFSVNPAKQIFHCFGCHAGGNVFTFLMRHEGLGFPEALRFLAQRAGIVLELEEKDDSVSHEAETLYYVNEFADKFFRETLWSSAGKSAMVYLADRGLQKSHIESFGIGYVPAGWDNLLKAASKAAFEKEHLLKSGLVLTADNDRTYDRFRDRIIFPIRNLSGRVVAFGGRILSKDDKAPKYINSPETTVYEKGKMLYGLFQNRDDVRKQDEAIFVEGYMDLLSLVARGVGNAVATLGTALTGDQAHLIRRYTRHVAMMYDSDSAGSAATLRAADILLENGLDVRIVTLPEGQDPDSFVCENGAEAVKKTLEDAKSVFEHKINILNKVQPEKRNEYVHSILDSLAKVKDTIERSLLVTQVSEKLRISERLLWAELEGILHRQKKGQLRQSSVARHLNDLGRVGDVSKIEKAVNDIIRILCHEWEYASEVFENIDTARIEELDTYPLLEFLKNQYKGGAAPGEETLLHHFHDVELSAFIVSAFNQKWEGERTEQWLLDCIRVIRQDGIQHEIETLREKIRQAQGRADVVRPLLAQCQQLEAEKQALYPQA